MKQWTIRVVDSDVWSEMDGKVVGDFVVGLDNISTPVAVVEKAALVSLTLALIRLLDWAEKNHEMPNYSEAIAEAREALQMMPMVAK